MRLQPARDNEEDASSAHQGRGVALPQAARQKDAHMSETIDLLGVNPTLSVLPSRQQVIIGCRLVERSADGPRISEKTIRLGITMADAMQLLALLSNVQQRLGIQGPDDQQIVVEAPPAKDRN
jgi:hypothetical protein